MKTTIFIRILLATLLPLVLVFSMVLVTISNIVYTNSAKSARETAALETKFIARQISEKINTMSGYLTLTSRDMAEVDRWAPDAHDRTNTLHRRLMEVDPAFCSTWFAFEPQAFPGEGHVYQSLVRTPEGPKTLSNFTPEILQNPELSPWYNTPLKTGRLYLNMAEEYDYGHGEGSRIAAAMTAPILLWGRPIGVVGIDIRYADMFETGSFSQNALWQFMLVSKSGLIVHAENQELTGRNLFDYPSANREEVLNAMHNEMPYTGEDYSPFSKAESLVSIHPVTTTGSKETLYLYLSMPIRSVYALADSSMQIIIPTSILGLILLVISLFWATRNIARPLRQLAISFDKAANGELKTDSEEYARDALASSNVRELDALRSSLRRMLAEIHQTHDLRLKAAEERVEKEKVLAGSQAKTQFLANMSHEIRTPMNAILGISQILLHNEEIRGRERKYIQDIKVSSEALLAIINDILDISRLESGKLTLEARSYDLHALLENLRTMGEYLAAPGGLEFSFTVAPNLPPRLHGDDARLRQVLLNLLSNSCKFTAQGSVSFTAERYGEFMRFTVTDTGSGIREEDLASLFEAFRRFDTIKNRHVQGTGLGLSICKSLVELMDGTLGVTSEYGRGSTFTVTIPLVEGEADPTESPAAGASRVYGPTIRILIVDDNEINLSVAEGLLTDIYGISCETALSGAEALEKIPAGNYTLIFMDHMMPEMDGVETTRRIRMLAGPWAKTPVIALTANAVKGIREAMLAAGIDDYLSKPIRLEDLDAILSRWIPDTTPPAATPSAEAPPTKTPSAETPPPTE